MKFKFFDITLDTRNDVATVTMNYPPVNAITLEVTKELIDLINHLEKRKVKGMIYTSYSDRVFSAGVDINELCNPNRLRVRNLFKNIEDAWSLLYNSSFPTIALITGHCMGAAYFFTLACEYRIMLNGYSIGMPETAVGIKPPDFASVAMNSAIGWRTADLLLNTSKLLTAKEAIKYGLIDEISPDRANALKKVAEFLKLCNGVCPLARTVTKESRRAEVVALMKRTLEEDLDTTVKYIMQPEYQEYIKKYFKKLKSKSSKL